MQIVVHELDSVAVKQKITVGNTPIQLAHVCAYLFRWLSPAGSVYLQLQDANGKKIADSDSVSIAALGSGNYWHGFRKFDLNASLKENTDYYLELKSSGYTYGALAYVGWCADYEWRNAFAATYSPSTGRHAPLGLRLWSYNFTNKGDLL